MSKNTRYSKEYINWLIKNAPDYTIEELVDKSIYFGYTKMNKKKLRDLFLRNTNVKWKNYHSEKANSNERNSKPIGTESTRSDGMTKIKIGNKKWIYKQRYVYEKYYGKLPDNYMVVFLDGDRTNYDIDNLMAVKKSEYNYVKNKELLSKNKELNKTALLTARLNYKAKEKQVII